MTSHPAQLRDYEQDIIGILDILDTHAGNGPAFITREVGRIARRMAARICQDAGRHEWLPVFGSRRYRCTRCDLTVLDVPEAVTQ